MIDATQLKATSPKALQSVIDAACRQIPPLWPLASNVAVNPYLGQTSKRLGETSAQLHRLGAGKLTMDRPWYLEQISHQKITEDALMAALSASPYENKPASLDDLLDEAHKQPAPGKPLDTIAQLAGKAAGQDWHAIWMERFSIWAGSHFDEGQALWSGGDIPCPWTSWRIFATNDLTPEILGLKGFSARVAQTPARSFESIAQSIDMLNIKEEALESYFHHLLTSLGGWAQYARYKLWQAELAGKSDTTLLDLLAIRLVWEEAFFKQYEPTISEPWQDVLDKHGAPACLSREDVIDEILQEAFERTAQKQLFETLATPLEIRKSERPVVQAAFCIDVRSEVFRRAFESLDNTIETIGFAGFFGIFTKHQGFASDVEEHRLPVLLNAGVQSCATHPHALKKDQQSRFRARAARAWGRFKLAAVSSFAFVEAMGPVYISKLLRDSLKVSPGQPPHDPKPVFAPELALEQRIEAAHTVLTAMSLTKGFAQIILLLGHGANVTNNPHKSALHCGACGGYSGEVNARLLASLLNDPNVRSGLRAKNIFVPEDTVFVPGLHDTTTDNVTLFEEDQDLSTCTRELMRIHTWLHKAAQLARTERMVRLPGTQDEAELVQKSRDWSEIRPEWGLAGCKAFIAAPRARTNGRNLGAQAFLHDYDWKQDQANGFGVLELIMTAPVVVASWISLQYFGSSVAPDVFGSGNKLLHNVVGGIGVLEGNGGNLRAGLAWQSVHDGDRLVHDPVRLSVCIEAPIEAMNDILERHDTVRDLFDNTWLHLFALDEKGQMIGRYKGNLAWETHPDFSLGTKGDSSPLSKAV